MHAGAERESGAVGELYPWEQDRKLYTEVMNHGVHHLRMELFRDKRDRDLLQVWLRVVSELRSVLDSSR
jgi:hypothetical protein